MGRLQNSLIWTGMPFLLAVLNGCSLSSSKDNPALHLDLSSLQDRSGEYALLSGGSLIHGLTPPQAATGFSCYGVNVTGPGIGDSSISNPDPNPQAKFESAMGGSYCSYRGIVTPPIQLTSTGGADISLPVPPGPVRLVQIIGVADPVICASGTLGNDSGTAATGGGGGGGRYFEIGRAQVQNLFSDQSVEITTAWPSGTTPADQLARAGRSLDCGGNCSNAYDYTNGVVASNPNPLIVYSATLSFKYAQKIPTVPGKYLRHARFFLSPSSAAVTAVVTLWQSTTGTAGPGAATAYTASIDLPASAPAKWVDFDLYNTSIGYLQMQSGNDYWAVISSPTSSTLSIGNAYNPNSANNDVLYFSGTSWAIPTSKTDGIYAQVSACSN